MFVLLFLFWRVKRRHQHRGRRQQRGHRLQRAHRLQMAHRLQRARLRPLPQRVRLPPLPRREHLRLRRHLQLMGLRPRLLLKVLLRQHRLQRVPPLPLPLHQQKALQRLRRVPMLHHPPLHRHQPLHRPLNQRLPLRLRRWRRLLPRPHQSKHPPKKCIEGVHNGIILL